MHKPASAVIGLALLLTAGMLIACSSEEDEAVRQSSTSSATPGSTLSYVDPNHGYSFDYPATWYLSPPEDNGGQVILYSYKFNDTVGDGRPVPKDKLKSFFWVAEGVDNGLAQWLAEGRAKASAEQNLPPPTVISQSPVVLADKQGIVEITESEGIKDISYYITLDGGRVFVVNAVPADSERRGEFDGVLATLRFAPSSQKEARLPGGFQFSYPPTWNQVILSDDPHIAKFFLSATPNSDGEEPAELEVAVYANPEQTSLETFFDGRERPNLFQDAVGGYKTFASGGATGYWFDNVLGFENYTVVALSSEGFVYQFSDAQRHQSDGVFSQIVLSLNRVEG